MIRGLEMGDETMCEPENQTDCPETGTIHMWIWDEDQDDYYCDDCGIYHDNQE